MKREEWEKRGEGGGMGEKGERGLGAFFHFLQYHNAIPITLGIIFLGAGATFAATNPEAIYSAEQEIVSIDNTYLADKDLSNWTPQIRIEGVTEDDASYYVAYTLSTIDLDGYAWKDVVKTETMSVSKSDLGQYRDLGVYVTQQLRQIIDRDLQKLRQTQEIEKRNISLAVVATAYGGLVGQLLNDTTEVLPGYTPVVQGPPEPAAQVAAAAAAAAASPAASAPPRSSALTVGSVLSGDPSDTVAPFLQILGPAWISLHVGDSYLDLGAVAADNGKTDAVDVFLYLNGTKVERLYMASAKLGEWVITYEARDKAGNITRAERLLSVTARLAVPPSSPEATEGQSAPEPDSATSTDSTSSPQADSTGSTTLTASSSQPSPEATADAAPQVEPTPDPTTDAATSTTPSDPVPDTTTSDTSTSTTP